MKLPSRFTKNVLAAFPREGRDWLASLPSLLKQAASRWDLTVHSHFLLSFNYVCDAERADGTPAVLKIGIPNRELISEIQALLLYDGVGACRLFESDSNAGMLLLERLQPGTMLYKHADDETQTRIAARLMQRLWRPAPREVNSFIHLEEWFDELKGLRARFGGGTGPYAEKTVNVVEGMVHELFSENRPQVLLHGDFHHFNILLSSRGWLAIDPKGVIGAPEYEAGPLMMNPVGQMPQRAKAIRRSQNRIAILSEMLGLDRQRLWRWVVCFSLLSSFWDVSADGCGGEYSRAWLEILLAMKV